MKKRIFVATPTTSNIVDAQSYFMRDIAKRYGDEVELVYPKECVRRMFHDYARNALVDEFLDSDCDALWFLDSDIVPPKHVLDLVSLHWDKWQCAGAPYPIFICPEDNKKPEVVLAVFNGTDGKGLRPSAVPYEGTAMVDGLATGCLFIRREVFAQLKKPYFEFKYDAESRQIAEGEDLGFCFKVNALGHKFFVDYSMVCKHYKTVDLLDVNNYAIEYANRCVMNYDSQVKDQVAALAAQLMTRKLNPTPNSSLVGARPTGLVGADDPQASRQSSIILPGHGSPFARGNGR